MMPVSVQPDLSALYQQLGESLAAVIQHPDCDQEVINHAYNFIFEVYSHIEERDRPLALAVAFRTSFPVYLAALKSPE